MSLPRDYDLHFENIVTDIAQEYYRNRRLQITVAIGALLVTAVGLLVAAVLVFTTSTAVDYPGAARVSEHSIIRLVPRIMFRQDTSYRTNDDVPVIYNFYSTRFNMGAEFRAQSSCLQLRSQHSWLLLKRQVSVTICDTPRGRMIFANRAFTLD